MVKAISGLLGVAGFIALCVVSFNFVEAHNSTEVKNKNSRLEEKVESLRTENGDLNSARVGFERKFRQACAALEKHEIELDVCNKQEEEDQAVEDEGSGE